MTLLLLVVAALWWTLGAEGRRVDAACDLYDGQHEPLRSALAQIEDAAAASAAAGDTRLLGYLENPDGTLNTLRRWQSTMPRVTEEIGTGESDAVTTFTDLTEAVAELQRLLETDDASTTGGYTAEVSAELDEADSLCDVD